jgi:hypothetical protein
MLKIISVFLRVLQVFEGKRQKKQIIEVFELLRFELVRFYCTT